MLGELTSGNQNVWFEDYLAGDFRLVNPPLAALTAARWSTGDPLVDIEGDARVAVDGEMEAAGADIP
jgi:hypothetical protein